MLPPATSTVSGLGCTILTYKVIPKNLWIFHQTYPQILHTIGQNCQTRLETPKKFFGTCHLKIVDHRNLWTIRPTGFQQPQINMMKNIDPIVDWNKPISKTQAQERYSCHISAMRPKEKLLPGVQESKLTPSVYIIAAFRLYVDHCQNC